MSKTRFEIIAEIGGLLSSLAQAEGAIKKTFAPGSVGAIRQEIDKLTAEMEELGDVEAIRQKQSEIASLDRQLGQLLGNINSSQPKPDSLFGSIFKGTLVSGLVMKGLDTVRLGIDSVADAMIGGNAQMEQYQTSFEVMIGSTEEAQKHLDDLKKFGAETPFEFPGLAKNSTLLQSFGVAADDVIPTLRMLGDVAQGDQQKLDGLALVFAQVRSAGKLQGQDLMQMINQGFNPLQIMSEKTGKSMSVLRAEMEKGQISFDMVNQSFVDATSEGGKFHGMMEKQSKTFAGLKSTLMDTLGEIGRTVGKPFFDEAKKGLIATLEFLGSDSVKGSIESLAKTVGGLFRWIVDHKTTLAILAAGVAALTISMNAATIATTATSLATKAYAAVQGVLNAVLSANPIGIVVLALAGLTAVIYEAATASDETINTLREWSPLLGEIVGGIKLVVETIGDWIASEEELARRIKERDEAHKAAERSKDIKAQQALIKERLDYLKVASIEELDIMAKMSKAEMDAYRKSKGLRELTQAEFTEIQNYIRPFRSEIVVQEWGKMADEILKPFRKVKNALKDDKDDKSVGSPVNENVLKSKLDARLAEIAFERDKAMKIAENEERSFAERKAMRLEFLRDELAALQSVQFRDQKLRDAHTDAIRKKQHEIALAELDEEQKKSKAKQDAFDIEKKIEEMRLRALWSNHEKRKKLIEEEAEAFRKSQEEKRKAFEDRFAEPVARLGEDVFRSLFDQQMTGAERSKMVWEGLGNVALNVLGELAATFIKNQLMAVASTIGLIPVQAATAATTAALWSPAATLASLASFGANSVPAQAGIASTFALTKALSVIPMAEGGILNKPVFVAGEAGAEVVAPLKALPGLIREAMIGDGTNRLNPLRRKKSDRVAGQMNVHFTSLAKASNSVEFRQSRNAL